MNGLPAPPDWTAPELALAQPAPAWFSEALASPFTSRFVAVEGCPIHYLLWPAAADSADQGLLFVHGGGAHANWWRFIAPFFTGTWRCAALDLSGMGDSGRRDHYDASLRAREMAAVIEHAALGRRVVVVGHSFGGYMTMTYGAQHGERIAGAVIVDSPIRRPGPDGRQVARRALSIERYYPSFDATLERFRLLPLQPCANDYLVEFIARHSIAQRDRGWTWKFDASALGARRFDDPFAEYLARMRCPAALIHGARSELVSRDTAAYMGELMGADTPVVEIPEAHHHLMLDQPLAFVAALRALLASWPRA